MSRASRLVVAVALLMTLALVLTTRLFSTGWAAGTTITAQRFYVESLTATPGVALQDTFATAGALNGRTVATIDPNGGSTFGTTTANRPTWTTTDTAWTTASNRALHGSTGAPSSVTIPWLSRSSYVQVRFGTAATASNAGLGILCNSTNSCIGARLRRASTTYYLDLGTLNAGSFTAATSPTCTSSATCTVTIGTSVAATTDLRLTYNATTNVVQMTFGALSASMTVPTAYRTNTRAGLFALANTDGTRFSTFQVDTQ